jgi:hypothetical protein
VDHTQLNLVAAHVDLHERLFQGLNSTGDVTLNNQVQRVHLALSHGGIEGFKGYALTTLRKLCVTVRCLTLLSDLACSAFFLGREEGITRTGHRRKAQNLHGTGRAGFFHCLAVFIEHCTHATVCHAGNNRITHMQGTGLHQDGGDRTAALVQVRFNGNAASFLIRVSTQF